MQKYLVGEFFANEIDDLEHSETGTNQTHAVSPQSNENYAEMN